LFSCGQVTESGIKILPPNVPVSKVSQVKQKRQLNSAVYLKGKVVKLIPFLGKRADDLKDDTGTITVVTKDKFPKPKEEILIQGKVLDKSVPAEGKDYGELYVEEQKRL